MKSLAKQTESIAKEFAGPSQKPKDQRINEFPAWLSFRRPKYLNELAEDSEKG